MNLRLRQVYRLLPRICLSGFTATVAIALLISPLSSQTTATGALAGELLDPSGAVIPGATLRLVDQSTSRTLTVISSDSGRFSFLLLPPGSYELQASKTDFTPLELFGLEVYVTETLEVEARMRLATQFQQAEVVSKPLMVQTDNSALGRVVNEGTLTGLPLVTRNFAQIAGLSPGVAVGVYNAGELGLGGTALSQIAPSNDGIFVHGARSYDNNFLLDGISVSDVQGSGSGSGGIPLPNPDSLQEFKVQTGQYDAGYGRYAGANVSLVTKTGANTFHGNVFEFFRNRVLNANDFFRNLAGQPRAVLNENQFGFSLGGPIKKEKLLFFSSYQGTRQVNGLASGQSRVGCVASVVEPPLTNDRSAAALGRLFAGMAGSLGGVTIKADGSNINSSALALANLKLPDGSFVIPTPQTRDQSKPLVQQGFSVFSDPCHFSQNQFLANLEYLPSTTRKYDIRFFISPDNQNVTFSGNGLNPIGNVPGFLSPSNSDFVVVSIARTDTFPNGSLNDARFGYVRTTTNTRAEGAFNWSDIGVAEGAMSNNNELPSLEIQGSVSIASGFPRNITQNSFFFGDVYSLVHGAHTLRLGGSITRVQDNINLVGLGSFLRFLSWPDFLLGLSAKDNGTTFSNVFSSFDDFGLTAREYRAWEGSAFVQDNYRITSSMTLNAGIRYERLGQFGDNLGRNATFDFNKAVANPPPEGSVAGYIVASNFPGTLPAGVARTNNTFGNYAEGQDTVAPRIGFAEQIMSGSTRSVLRGGYGIYYSRPTGQAFYQNVLGAPFSEFRLNSGLANANATFQAPFPQPFPTPQSFPMFPAYSPVSTTTVYAVSPYFRSAIIQQYSLNLQAEASEDWLLEVGYVGTHGSHLVRQRSLNQALSASAEDPIRGVSTNTVANIALRLPVLGIPPDSGVEMESEGGSSYNGLEVSMTKRLSHGFQFLASYTFSKTLDTDGADINSTSSGNGLTLGDQNSPGMRWGRASFDRTHRFIISGIWELPSPAKAFEHWFLGGWEVSGIATIQSGRAMTIADTNPNNVFGISEDKAGLSGTCTKSQFVTNGPITNNLDHYFNASCFITPLVIGADGIGTGFGNSATGITNGPRQTNIDLAISKTTPLRWLSDRSSVQFRTEMYNALNHPQFADPDNDFASPAFGVITRTSVNPRVVQFALKLAF
jgi:Carboxypeptidase regulatory-like domain